MIKNESAGKAGTKKITKHIQCHKDGSIWAKGNFVNGKFSGYWEWFRKDGTKMRSGYFENGKQTGKWTTYGKKGRVVKITSFDKGKTCSRGHKFRKSSNYPVCPVCWPGYYKERAKKVKSVGK